MSFTETVKCPYCSSRTWNLLDYENQLYFKCTSCGAIQRNTKIYKIKETLVEVDYSDYSKELAK